VSARDPSLSDAFARLASGRRLHGISATLLPYTHERKIDWKGFERHVVRTRAAGLDVAVNMDTGFGDLLSESEREAVLDATRGALGAELPFYAGAFAALVLTGEVTVEWRDRYCDWLDREADPRTGLWRRGCVPAEPKDPGARFVHLAGSFHYLFNLEHERRPLPYPPALVDTCLEIFERGTFPLGAFVWFAEIDWVHCLARSLRQSGHRFREVREALLALAEVYIPFLCQIDLDEDEAGSDLHRLFGATCALAELQAALPGDLRTERPLRLVLDRRPFI
jgi:hypothetical protein